LFEQAQLTAGQSVLIHGAAGNVGAFAVQLARSFGIQTFATAGGSDLDYVRELGANTVIDFQTSRFEEEIDEVDAVLDLVGGETQKRSFEVLRPGGKLISAVAEPDQGLARSRGVEGRFFLVRVTAQDLQKLADLFDNGELKTRIGAVLKLADAREAHLMLDGRRPAPKGKIVLATQES